jgi:hypothetical protein
MFRKRPFRRRIPHPIPAIRRAALKRLQRANQLMSEGSYAEAGRIYEELAIGAAGRRLPRAPGLFLQAGNAFLKSGESDHGIDLLRQGFQLMERMGQYHRLHVASQRVLNELGALNLTQERDMLNNEIQQLLSQHDLSFPVETQKLKPRLPGKCPQCGGTVHPNEVEWIDERTASCDYCGSILEG